MTIFIDFLVLFILYCKISMKQKVCSHGKTGDFTFIIKIMEIQEVIGG